MDNGYARDAHDESLPRRKTDREDTSIVSNHSAKPYLIAVRRPREPPQTSTAAEERLLISGQIHNCN